MLTFGDINKILKEVSFPGVEFHIGGTDDLQALYLQVVCPDGVCNVTGLRHHWKGRKWRLSPFMTKSEVVQTAFKAALTALEHEARENFKYRGVSIFDPHYDVDKLHALRSDPESLSVRVEP